MSEVAGERDSSGRRTVWALALLAVLAVVYFAWPVWRAQFPLEMDLDEPWNAFNAERLLRGEPLYPDPQSLITNNYPPLSFVAVAGLTWLGLDAGIAGRLLSLLAVVATALSIGGCVRLLGGGRAGAALGGLWFVATSARFFDNYVGKDDPHLPGLAIMTVALWLLLRAMQRGRAAEPAILLMALAGFYKHTLIATPLTALLWLAGRDRRKAGRAALVGIAACAAGLVACVAIFGENFIAQLLFPREYWWRWAVGGLGQLQWIAPALLMCVAWWWYDRDSEAARFTRSYAAIAFVSHFIQRSGQGVGINAQFELVVATAIATGLAFDRIMAIPLAQRLGRDWSRAALIGMLVVRLLASTRLEAYLLFASADFRAGFYENSTVMMRDVERVRAIPDPVHCALPSVCRRAGKAFVLDPFAMSQRIATGRMTPAGLAARIKAAGIRQEAVDPRAYMQKLYRRR